jgi:hypothetical protein
MLVGTELGDAVEKCWNFLFKVRCQVLMAGSMKMTVFWDVA